MTIINQTHAFVFIHIPKNAGTSISQYLSQVSTYRDIEIGATKLGESHALHYRTRFSLQKHSTYRELAEVMGDDLASHTTFAVIRDPFDRIRSVFLFLRAWKAWETLPELKGYAGEFARVRDVDAFVRSDFFNSSGPDRLFLPQAAWVTDASGRVRVDRLLLLDSLKAEMGRLVADLRLPREQLAVPLATVNASRRRRRLRRAVGRWLGDPAGGFSGASETLIADRYHEDFAMVAALQSSAAVEAGSAAS